MNKKYYMLLLLFCGSMLNAQVINDDNKEKNANESLKDGQNKFAIFGNAEMTFFSDKNSVQFGEVNFKPILAEY